MASALHNAKDEFFHRTRELWRLTDHPGLGEAETTVAHAIARSLHRQCPNLGARDALWVGLTLMCSWSLVETVDIKLNEIAHALEIEECAFVRLVTASALAFSRFILTY